MSGDRLITASTIRNVVLAGLGAVLVLIGLAAFGYSHEGSTVIVFIGMVVLCAGVLPVVHNLPPDSSPW